MALFKKNKKQDTIAKEDKQEDNHVIDIPPTPEQKSAIPAGLVEAKEAVKEKISEDNENTRNLDKERTDAILEKEEKALKTVEKTIEAAAKRGENIADLEDLSANVADQSEAFGKRATKVKSNLWYKNQKMNLIIALVILVVLLIVFGAWGKTLLGFFNFSSKSKV